MNLRPPSAPPEARAWMWNGDEPRVVPVFQPIVDLQSGAPIGYEVLSRGKSLEQAPSELFSRARAEGVCWELERACWTAAVRRISELPATARQVPFFFNVSPDVLSDPRFNDGSMLALLQRHGVQPWQVVLEITETAVFENAEQMERLIRRHAEHGFGIALDDFGAGHSGLVTLVHSAPDFIKLDQALVREIQRHAYRQQLVKSLVAFASSVDAMLIAEGVETWEELTVLLRLGVRYVQGFLVARPASTPPPPLESFERRRHEAIRELHFRESEDDETVGSMVIRRPCIEPTLSREMLDTLFRRTPELDHVVLLRGEKPGGLVTRRQFYERMAGPSGAPGPPGQTVEEVANTQPLVVEDTMAITALARLAMERPPENVYDPVVVADQRGRFLGTVTMKQLISRATELEVRAATGANPLTHLPGNRLIERWIRQAARGERFCVIYGDLDHFKEYNDRYGFLQGDRLIRLTARVLSEGLHRLPSGSHLGHVGGDDFILVCPGEVTPEALEALCREFDAEKRDLFEREDLERGYFEAVDRQGHNVRVPPVTLSLAALDSRNMGTRLHPASISTLAASLKKKVKELSDETHASAFMFERRANP